MSEENPETQQSTETGQTVEERTFTQSDLDRIVQERLAADRRARDLTPDEVKALKDATAKAQADAEAASDALEVARQRQAEAERAKSAAEHEALVARLQVPHGISDEDAMLFLTGSDAETLTRQADRLGALLRASAKPSFGPMRSGANAAAAEGDDERAFLRNLLAQAGD